MQAVADEMKSFVRQVAEPYTLWNDPCAALILVLATGATLHFLAGLQSRAGGRENGGMYGLEHGRLNIVAKPATMWMNIGFWKNTSDFPTACRDLLIEVLSQAGLVERLGNGLEWRLAAEAGDINILDLGFGCGDQTLCLAGIWHGHPFKYVGLTLNHTQYKFAHERLLEANVWDAKVMKVYCENAARPQTWREEIMRDVLSLKMPSSWDEAGDGQNGAPTSHTWVLALDTLYHFTPSRLPVLSFAANELRASLMAFDFLRANTAPLHQRVLLRLVALVSGCAGSAFMTEDNYRRMLMQAGYDGDIQIVDVTKYTFQPLSNYMSKQEADLKRIGLSLGKLKAGKWLFKWFARSSLVRAVIVVAKCYQAET